MKDEDDILSDISAKITRGRDRMLEDGTHEEEEHEGTLQAAKNVSLETESVVTTFG